MIRSLVAYVDETESEINLRRNLERCDLEQHIQDNYRTWIDIVDPEDEEIAWLAQVFDLTPAVVDDLGREDRRPALLVYPTYLFLSLFEPRIHLKRVEGREIHCLMTNNCFITVRASDAEAADTAYERVAMNPETWRSGVPYFLYLTSQFVIDAYYPLVDQISNQLNALEETLLIAPLNHQGRKPIYHIKQQLINLRQMVAPQREVISNVIGENRLAENGDTRDLFRHLYERLLRVYDIIDSQRDHSSNVLDMIQNQESHRLVEAVNRLTILSMIFLPLTFFTSLFELNFATTSDPIVLPISGGTMFLAVIVAMVGSASVMIYIFRRKRWL